MTGRRFWPPSRWFGRQGREVDPESNKSVVPDDPDQTSRPAFLTADRDAARAPHEAARSEAATAEAPTEVAVGTPGPYFGQDEPDPLQASNAKQGADQVFERRMAQAFFDPRPISVRLRDWVTVQPPLESVS